MEKTPLLNEQHVLVVDDEPDVLETLDDLLSMCQLTRASSYSEAKKLFETKSFDMAVLDIMGVDGFSLLDIAVSRNVTAVMLTAHAIAPKHVVKSYRKGAAFYIPKDELARLPVFLNDVLEAKKKGKNPWWQWMEKVGESYFNDKFGPDWQDHDPDFWSKFEYI